MNKTWAAIALFLVSSPALAEWELVSKDADGYAIYIEKSNIRHSDHIAKVWEMDDFPTNNGKLKNYRSTKSQREYDCAEEKTRLLYIVAYAENMGTGKPVGSYDRPGDWTPIIPGSNAGLLYRIVCVTP